MSAPVLTQQQINRFRVLLEARRQELALLLEDAGQAAQPVKLDQQAVGRVSRVDAIQQQQMALANREQALALCRQVESALRRIDCDEYGLCLECAESIPLARLEAQPQAELCVDCQALSEND